MRSGPQPERNAAITQKIDLRHPDLHGIEAKKIAYRTIEQGLLLFQQILAKRGLQPGLFGVCWQNVAHVRG